MSGLDCVCVGGQGEWWSKRVLVRKLERKRRRGCVGLQGLREWCVCEEKKSEWK